MDEKTLEIVDGKRVKTPMGNGLVIGRIHRARMEIIVSLDEKPVTVFDKGQNPILVWSFVEDDLEVIHEK